MVNAIFTEDGGEERCAGYTTVPYSSEDSEALVETTEDDLASIFETAKANGETLDGADASIDAAVDDPLSHLNYLILDDNGNIVFDPDYVRETPDGTQS